MPAAARSITLTMETCKDGFSLRVTEQETVVDEDDGAQHIQKEVSSATFGPPAAAIEAAVLTMKRFVSRLKAPAGELFA